MCLFYVKMCPEHCPQWCCEKLARRRLPVGALLIVNQPNCLEMNANALQNCIYSMNIAKQNNRYIKDALCTMSLGPTFLIHVHVQCHIYM